VASREEQQSSEPDGRGRVDRVDPGREARGSGEVHSASAGPHAGSLYHERLWESLPEDLRPPHLQARLAFVLEHVGVGERVLDVGCGDGHIAAELERAARSVLAIDVAREPLRRARARSRTLALKLVAPGGPWPLADCEFDAVWAGDVIEHVADIPGWLSEIRRVLRSGGSLSLSTPDHGPLTRLRLGLSPRAFAAHFDPRSDHLRCFTRPALVELLGDFGFEALEVRGLGGYPGARELLLLSARRARF
jgi:2-polyprenyl-3-methyl-5-hydroxy-6-metoxy-1,4-benzoquinol methylase